MRIENRCIAIDDNHESTPHSCYKVHATVDTPLLCVAVVGDLSEHIDKVTNDVKTAIHSAALDRVLIDIRNTYTRSTASEIFIQALKYRSGREIKLALVGRREHRRLCSLLECLLRHKGLKVASFDSIAPGRRWLIRDQHSEIDMRYG